MSNYSSLKATINANIKTNGNQEITGSVMNSVLLAMVNTLGAGYQYAGVANPNDVPGTPDSNVFYLATTKGTYSNFGGIVVDSTEIAILKYNGSWTKESLLSGAIEHSKNFADYSSVLDGIYPAASGALSSNAATKSIKFPCKPSTTYTISKIVTARFRVAYYNSDPVVGLVGGGVITNNAASAITITTGSDSKYIVAYVYDSSVETHTMNEILASLQIEEGGTATQYAQPGWVAVDRTARDGVTSLNSRTQTLETSVEQNTNLLGELDKDINAKTINLSLSDVITGKYRAITGSLASSNAYFYTNPIRVNNGDRVVITDANIVTAVSVISEVDANNNFISVIYAGQGAVASHTFTASRDMFIGLSAPNSQISTIEIQTKGVLNRLTDDEDDIKDLQEILADTTRGLETTDVVTGSYWAITGILGTLSAYFHSNPIKLHKGDRIATDTAISTITAVSYITQVDEENNFIAVLKPGTGETEMIDFTIPEDGYFSISALNNQRTKFVIYQNGIESRIDGLVADVASVSPAADTKLPAITDNPLSSIRRDAGYGAIIRKWGIIGDSLSSGEMQCYNDESTSSSNYKFIDMYKYSSGQVFARLIGAEAYNFSNGGQTTWGWLKNQGVVRDESYIGGVGGGDWSLASQSGQEKHGYIIAMGVNDRAKIENGDYALGDVSQITTYDGTDSDIDNTTTYPKSFVRYYAGIIQRLLSIQPKAKIFCVTPLGENYAAIAQAIRDIVEYFGGNVYLLDMRTYIPEDYRVQGFMLNGHLSPMGYAYIGYLFNTYIDWIIRKNASAFRDTALIGTNYRPDFS